jgi:ribonuclease I
VCDSSVFSDGLLVIITAVHGLWPQNGNYGTSACVPPKDSDTRKAYLPPCYDNDEAQKDLVHQETFVEHEWTKHVSSSFIDTSIQALETSNLPLFVS